MVPAALVNSSSRLNSGTNDTSYDRAQSWIDQGSNFSATGNLQSIRVNITEWIASHVAVGREATSLKPYWIGLDVEPL